MKKNYKLHCNTQCKGFLLILFLLFFNHLSAQTGPTDDWDGDGILNQVDQDDDNDGISDDIEAPNINSISNPTFTGNTTGWTLNGGWALFLNQMRNVKDNVLASPEYLTYENAVLKTPCSYTTEFTVRIRTVNYINTAGEGFDSDARLRVYVGGVQLFDVYNPMSNSPATVTKQAGANVMTSLKINGTTINSNTTTVPINSYSTYSIILNPASLPSTGSIAFRYTANDDDFYIDDVYYNVKSCPDTDQDGIPDQFDLDSDGDGCPDATEGGGGFSTSNLRTASINGGNTGSSYNGYAGPVASNLGNTVNGNGIPTIAGTGQTVGNSQIKSPDDDGDGIGNSCDPVDNRLDTDGDGIRNDTDIDDDNDGILDTAEGYSCATAAATKNLSFVSHNIPAQGTSFCGGLQNSYTSAGPTGYFKSENDITGTYTVNFTYTDLTVGLPAVFQYRYFFDNVDGNHGVTGSNTSNSKLTGKVYLNNTLVRTITFQGTDYYSSGTWNSLFTYDFTPATASGTVKLEITFERFNGYCNVIPEVGFDSAQIKQNTVTCTSVDTDGDGIPNHLDTDSDNDGCSDAKEAGVIDYVAVHGGTYSPGTLNNPSATSSPETTVGNNTPANYGANGFYTIIENNDTLSAVYNGTYTYSNATNAAVTACFPACFKPAITAGTVLPTLYGITALGRAAENTGSWPGIRKGGWMAIEAKTKGFVPNRLTDGQITAIPAANLAEGMMVYNSTSDCLYINTDGTASGWKCFNTRTCP